MLNTSDRQGGAAVAASRLKEALIRNGAEVKLIVRDKISGDPDTLSINNNGFRRKINRLRFLWERLVIFLHNGFSREKLFKVSIADTGTDLSRLKEVQEADLIHLHWINHGFLSLKDLKKILGMGKPVVWTLHDMWAATGICHHAWSCDHYQSECGFCPFLGSSKKTDLSTRVFRKKKKLYTCNLTLVPVSRWLQGECEKSALTGNLQIESIPNPIDTDFFEPGNKAEARREAGLPTDRVILLMGAFRIDDPVKGFSCLKKSLGELNPEVRDKIQLVLFGGIKNEEETLADIPVGYTWLNRVSDPEKLRALYRSADFFMAPSLEDNLPNTVMESLACGTPVIGFRTGGIPEMVDHLGNGYLAPRGDTQALAKGIEWALNYPGQASLSVQARMKILSCFTIEKIAGKYMDLYKTLVP